MRHVPRVALRLEQYALHQEPEHRRTGPACSAGHDVLRNLHCLEAPQDARRWFFKMNPKLALFSILFPRYIRGKLVWADVCDKLVAELIKRAE
jgi:hypothetical protein